MRIQPNEFNGDWNQGIFSWCFHLMLWNLIARSSFVCNIMLAHMSWRGDALMITMVTHKADQEGNRSYARIRESKRPVPLPNFSFGCVHIHQRIPFD